MTTKRTDYSKFLDSLYDICDNNLDLYICEVDGVTDEYERLVSIVEEFLEENEDLTDNQIDKLKEVKDIFDTNTKVDWMENDPKEEFLAICSILEDIKD